MACPASRSGWASNLTTCGHVTHLVTRTNVENALLAKGMERHESHHHMFKKSIDGVTHLVTRTSHNMPEIGTSLAKRMRTNAACNSGSSGI